MKAGGERGGSCKYTAACAVERGQKLPTCVKCFCLEQFRLLDSTEALVVTCLPDHIRVACRSATTCNHHEKCCTRILYICGVHVLFVGMVRLASLKNIVIPAVIISLPFLFVGLPIGH